MSPRHLPAGLLLVLLTLMMVFTGGPVLAQDQEPDSPEDVPYGETPDDLVPYRETGKPYSRFFVEPPKFRGPGRDEPEPTGLTEVKLGVLAPLYGLDQALGVRMQNGIELAVEQANAAGGYRGKLPFRTLLRDENQAWGAAANDTVDLVFEEGVWGIVGALEDSASHVVTRVLLKAEVPTVNANGPDPTLTEHAIPWVVRVRPDDRRNCYRLAQRIFQEDGHKRVVVFRSNDRYGRMGIKEFVDAARRLHHPIMLEVRFENFDTSWDTQIERIRSTRPHAIVLWGRAEAAGRALKALREAGLDQPVYGPDRLMDPVFLAGAGAAADGTVFTYPFDPDQKNEPWQTFRRQYRERFGSDPDAVAAYAYDGTRYLIEAIGRAGLNRPRIADELFVPESFPGVMGLIKFDPTHNNVSPVLLGRVQDGKFRFD